MLGHAVVHTVVDDHIRIAYAEVHDESAAAAEAVLRRAVLSLAARGVTVQRLLMDNAQLLSLPSLRQPMR